MKAIKPPWGETQTLGETRKAVNEGPLQNAHPLTPLRPGIMRPSRRRRSSSATMILGGIVLLGAILAIVFLVPQRSQNKEMLAQLESDRQALQRHLFADPLSSLRATTDEILPADWRSPTSLTSPDTQAAINQLEASLGAFEKLAESDEKRADPGRETAAEKLQVRIAKATLANANGAYKTTTSLISEEEGVFSSSKTSKDNNSYATLAFLRGDAMYNLQRWEAARKSFNSLLNVEGFQEDARLRLATCYFRLGGLSEADEHYTALIHQVGADDEAKDDVVNKEKALMPARWVYLTQLYCCHAAVHNKKPLPERESALDDLNRAVEIYDRLIAQASSPDWVVQLAMALKLRGYTYHSNGEGLQAIEDFERAVPLFEGIDPASVLYDFRLPFAQAYEGRAARRYMHGRIEESLPDYNEAIKRYAELVEGEGRTDLMMSFANLFLIRGNAHRQTGDMDQAFSDYDRSIDIYMWSSSQEDGTQAMGEIASVLNNRCLAYRGIGNYDAAFADLDEAIAIYSDLVNNRGRADFQQRLQIVTDLRPVLMEQKERWLKQQEQEQQQEQEREPSEQPDNE